MGARRSPRRGSSVEFAEHRPYAPGDDVRRIDWKVFARLETLVVKLFVAEEDLTVHLLVDASRSLGIGEPTKLATAKRIAAGLGYLALSANERVTVVPFADGRSTYVPAGRGRKRVAELLRILDGLEASGTTDLAGSVEAFLARRPRRGLVVVLSDLLDPGGYERPLARLLADRHEVVVFHVLAEEELEPARGGDVTLVDAENGRRVEVSLDGRTLAAYRARLARFLAEAEAYARRRGIRYVRVEGGARFEEALLGYLGGAP